VPLGRRSGDVVPLAQRGLLAFDRAMSPARLAALARLACVLAIGCGQQPTANNDETLAVHRALADIWIASKGDCAAAGEKMQAWVEANHDRAEKVRVDLVAIQKGEKPASAPHPEYSAVFVKLAPALTACRSEPRVERALVAVGFYRPASK
jgi:hypothetical protein